MKRFLYISLFLVFILALVGCNQSSEAGQNDTASSGEYPSEQLNFSIAFGPGGGNDVMARTIIDILQKYDLYTENIVAENRVGGSGAVGWGYVNNQKGNPYHITVTSGAFVSTPLISDADFSYETFTPIGVLAADDMLLIVDGKSEYETLEDFIQVAKESDDKVTIAGVSALSTDRMIPHELAKAAGFEFEFVPFQESGQMKTALTSGSVDAIMTNPSEALGELDAGTFHALAFSGEERMEELPDIPTIIELGYDVSLPMQRGIVLPGDVSEEVQQWWIDTMKEVVETPEWKDYIQKNSLSDFQVWGDEYQTFLEERTQTYQDFFDEIGVTTE